MEIMLDSAFYLLLVGLILLGMLGTGYLLMQKIWDRTLSTIFILLISYLLTKSDKFIPDIYAVAIIWDLLIVSVISILISCIVCKIPFDFQECRKFHPYTVILIIAFLLYIIVNLTEGREGNLFVLGIVFLCIAATFIFSFLFMALLADTPRNVWVGNLFSQVLLQVIGYTMLKSVSCYGLIVFFLFWGQGLSVSVSLYLDARKKIKTEAEGE